jgi:hypothetical protein
MRKGTGEIFPNFSYVNSEAVSARSEADNVYHWCQPDKDALAATGLDWSIVEDIPVRSGALGEAESIWIMERYRESKFPGKSKNGLIRS